MLYREMARAELENRRHHNGPSATFYLFPAIPGDDVAVAKRWLDEIDVSCLPGSFFGAPGKGHLRLSLTCPDAHLEEALDRIARVGLAA